MEKGRMVSGRQRLLRTAGITLAAGVCLILAVFWYGQSQKSYAGVRFSNRAAVVSAIREGLRQHSWQITIRFTAHSDSMDEIGGLVKELVEEALSETDDPAGGDYIRFQYGGYEVRYSYERQKKKYHYTVRIIPEYYTTPEQEARVTEEASKVLESFGFDENTTDYEKVRAIYEYVCQTVSYDKVHKDRDDRHLKTTAYSALIYKTAVCQGYSVLLYRLLREAGIETRIVTGRAVYEGYEEFHAWNIVRVDGLFYNLDATWDRALETEAYFLKRDAGFADHTRDAEYRTEEFQRRYPMSETDYEESR